MDIDPEGILLFPEDEADHQIITVIRSAWNSHLAVQKNKKTNPVDPKVAARHAAGMKQLPGQEKKAPRQPLGERLAPWFRHEGETLPVVAINQDELPIVIKALRAARFRNSQMGIPTFGDSEGVAKMLNSTYVEDFKDITAVK